MSRVLSDRVHSRQEIIGKRQRRPERSANVRIDTQPGVGCYYVFEHISRGIRTTPETYGQSDGGEVK